MNLYEYWDSIADRQIKEGKFNFWKTQCLVRKMLNYDLKGHNILEIGPGMGFVASALFVPYGGYNYYAQEPSRKWAEKLKERKPEAIAIGTADDLKFDDGMFHDVFLFDVLEHIHPDSRDKSYSEISRVCKKRAMIFINNPLEDSEHSKEYDYGFHDMDLANLAKAFDGVIWELDSYIVPMLNRLYQFIVIIRGDLPMDRMHKNYPSYLAGKEIL